MRTILTRKFFGATRSDAPGTVVCPRPVWRRRRLARDQSGQGILEYILVLVIVLGTVFVLARPVIARLQSKFEKGLKGGIFKEDPTGSNFYYFPLK